MDEIEQRKENIKNYIKNNKQLLVYAILVIIIIFGFWVRTFNFDLLKDFTTGKYISLELDSTLFLRYAQYIAEYGTLYTIDPMRFVPLGGNINYIGLFTSYFVAYLYQFLHFFDPSITIEYVDLLYPPLSMAIMSTFFFLLIKRLFNWKMGLLAVAMIQFIPSFLFRSVSSDHDMLAMMFIIMTFYLYVVAWQSEKLKNKIIFGVLAAITTILTQETAGSSSFIFIVIGGFTLIEYLLNKIEENDYFQYLSWFLPFMIMSSIISGVGSIKASLGSLVGIIPYITLLILTIDFIISKKDLLKIKNKLEKIKLPENILIVLITFFSGLILLLIIFGPEFFLSKLSDINRVLLHSFSADRWILTVAESQRPYVIQWFGQFGLVITWSMILGSILLFYQAVKEIDKKKYLTASYTVFIFMYIFSRYSQTSIFNGDSTISKLTFYVAIIGFAGIIIYSYLNVYYKDHLTYKEISKIDPKYAFIFVWYLLSIVAASSAIRLTYEFTPVVVIIASFLIISLFDYFYTRKEPLIKYAGIILLVLLLFNPFTIGSIIPRGAIYQDTLAAYNQMSYMGPGYNQQWQYAGKWVRENTPESAVFTHWWDYGYWVQSGFERATVGDGGNYYGWWNYLMGRKVLTGQTQEEGLPFLYSHNATHLLIVQDEIGKYTAYSSIGSDENYDRFSWITTFSLSPQQKETRNGVEIYYQGGFPLDEDFVYQGKVFPAQMAGIFAVKVPFENVMINNTKTQRMLQPIILMGYQNNQIELPLKCMFINNQLYEFENASYDGCFRIVPVIQSQTESNAMGAGYLLSRRTYHSNFGQLYMLNKPSPYFKLVYDDSQGMPLAIYQGRQIGPIKIWEINYPKNFTLTKEEYEYNLRTTYPNQELLKPR